MPTQESLTALHSEIAKLGEGVSWTEAVDFVGVPEEEKEQLHRAAQITAEIVAIGLMDPNEALIAMYLLGVADGKRYATAQTT